MDDVLIEKWFTAASEGDIKTLEECLNAGIYIDVKNKIGSTALFMAVCHKRYEIIEFIINKGANVNCQNPSGNNTLMRAVERCAYGVATMLVDKNADVNVRNMYGTTALMFASNIADNNDVNNFVMLLLNNGADITYINNDGIYALHIDKSYWKTTVPQEFIINNQPQSIPFFENRIGFNDEIKSIPAYASEIETYMAAAEFGMFVK